MKLGEAIERGYAQVPGQWGQTTVYDPDKDTYCAMGLALLGLGEDVLSLQHSNPDTLYEVFEHYFGLDAQEVYCINDIYSHSYEDVLLNLKQCGLYDKELITDENGTS